MRFQGKTILVTGAAGGIGRNITTAFEAEGARIAVTDLDTKGIEAEVAFDGDLTDRVFCDALPQMVKDKMGSLDIVINNAGITRDNLVLRMKQSEWEDVIQANLTAAFKLSQACVKAMIRRRWGRIINISSIVGRIGNAGQANYAASKAGVTGMTKALAAEVASRNITVNCVAPGFIVTPMTDVLEDSQKEALLSAIPVGRLGEPEDVAACVSFLASTEAAYITGQTVHVNGGMAMI